jgi:hypothetical protein
MRRKGVVREFKIARDVASRHALGPALNQQTKNLETALLAERR